MPFKINIADKDKTWKVESASEALIGKKIGEHVPGNDVADTLEGYEFTIAGASDISGLPHKKDVEGPTLRRVLLTKGWGMHDTHEGIRRRKTVRGRQLSDKTSQINLIVTKHGSAKLHDLFPDQNKPKEKAAEAAAA